MMDHNSPSIISGGTTTATATTIPTVVAMEKLELLSNTALLKQGMDDTGFRSGTSSSNSSCISRVETPASLLHHQQSPCTSVFSPHTNTNTSSSLLTKPIFTVGSASSVPGLLKMNETPITKKTLSNNNLASPVSTDGDEEEEQQSQRMVSIGSKTSTSNNGCTNTIITSTISTTTPKQDSMKMSGTTNNNHTPIPVVEARSPVSTVMEYGHTRCAVDVPTSPPKTFGGYPLPPRYESFQHQHHSVSTNNHTDASAFRAYSNGGGLVVGGYPPFLSASSSSGTIDANGAHYPPPHHHHHGAPSMMAPHSMMMIHHHPVNGSNNADNEHDTSQKNKDSKKYNDMARELEYMKEQLKEKDMVVSSLQSRVNCLENQINELRQLPTGKISHIPIE